MKQNFILVKIQSICRGQRPDLKKCKLASGRVENIVGKGENAVYQHFLLFLQCFQWAFSSTSSKLVVRSKI